MTLLTFVVLLVSVFCVLSGAFTIIGSGPRLIQKIAAGLGIMYCALAAFLLGWAFGEQLLMLFSYWMVK